MPVLKNAKIRNVNTDDTLHYDMPVFNRLPIFYNPIAALRLQELTAISDIFEIVVGHPSRLLFYQILLLQHEYNLVQLNLRFLDFHEALFESL